MKIMEETNNYFKDFNNKTTMKLIINLSDVLRTNHKLELLEEKTVQTIQNKIDELVNKIVT